MMRIGIIGGGVAGLHLASRLAGGGLSVRLFDHRTPYEKPCGGGMTSRTFEKFPFLKDPRLPRESVDTVEIHAPNGHRCVIRVPEPIHIVSRKSLGLFLLEETSQSGVDLIPERVERVHETGAGWELSTSGGVFPADYLILAAGCSSRISGAPGQWPGAEDLSLGVAYYPDKIFERKIILKFLEKPGTYLWIFPRVDHSSAGICAPLQSSRVHSLVGDLRKALFELVGRDPLDGLKPSVGLIPSLRRRTRTRLRISGKRWSRIGDAGGFANALTKEGIYFALESAEHLSRAILSGRAERYPKNILAVFNGEFKIAAGLAKNFFRPAFIDWLVNKAACDGAMRHLLARLLSASEPLASLETRVLRIFAGRDKPDSSAGNGD
jgi:flavin-dependent dehydrogenase